MDEVGLLRGGQAQDLLDAGRRADYLARLRAMVEVLINSPPCDTFSRARHSAMPGPPPVRDWQRQRGFNNLAPWAQKSVQDANTLADFALEAMHVAADAGVLAVREFPEDLGRTHRGTPASLWRWPRAQQLASEGMVRGAIYQKDWAQVDYLKPTGLCTNAPHLAQHELFH